METTSGRSYTVDGIEVPSVTTILKLISTNDALMQWANAMGFKRKALKALQEESTSFGTCIHAHLQHLVEPGIYPNPGYKDALEEYRINAVMKRFRDYFKDIPYSTIHSEKTIISSKLGYGGTLDWKCILHSDIKCLIDFKSSKRVVNTMFLQLGGYYNLLNEIGEAGDLDLAGILIINERECNLYPIDVESLVIFGELFNLLTKFYNDWNNTQPNINMGLLDELKGVPKTNR